MSELVQDAIKAYEADPEGYDPAVIEWLRNPNNHVKDPNTVAGRIAILRRIVEQRNAVTIHYMVDSHKRQILMDMQTANLLVAVFDRFTGDRTTLNRFMLFPWQRMAEAAWKMARLS